MTGLGSAGSRRGIYLGEDQPPEKPSTSNGSPDTSSAPTFLMYNKISTTISGQESPTTNGMSGNEVQKPKGDTKKKNDQKNRESAIW